MAQKNLRLVIFLCFLSIITLCSFAPPPNEVPGEAIARMHKLGEQLATPNENHAFLSNLAGNWKTTSTVMGIEAEEGTASYELILGGRFLNGTHGGLFMGIPFEGEMTIGYDNYKHKFVAIFFDNLGTSIRTAEGMLNRKRTTLSMWGAMDEWMTDEHDRPVKYLYRLLDDNHFVFEVHDLGIIDGETRVIQVQFERSTKINPSL